jgi:hypothetical protein
LCDRLTTPIGEKKHCIEYRTHLDVSLSRGGIVGSSRKTRCHYDKVTAFFLSSVLVCTLSNTHTVLPIRVTLHGASPAGSERMEETEAATREWTVLCAEKYAQLVNSLCEPSFICLPLRNTTISHMSLCYYSFPFAAEV